MSVIYAYSDGIEHLFTVSGRSVFTAEEAAAFAHYLNAHGARARVERRER